MNDNQPIIRVELDQTHQHIDLLDKVVTQLIQASGQLAEDFLTLQKTALLPDGFAIKFLRLVREDLGRLTCIYFRDPQGVERRGLVLGKYDETAQPVITITDSDLLLEEEAEIIEGITTPVSSPPSPQRKPEVQPLEVEAPETEVEINLLGNAEPDNSLKEPSVRETPSEAQKQPAVILYVMKEAIDKAWKHVQSPENQRREVGGVIVGKARRLPQKGNALLVVVFDVIPGRHNVERGASLTFTADMWKQVNEEMDEKYHDPDRKEWLMVGWYHSHPGFGVFLSANDRHLHTYFFPMAFHLAWVLDPADGQDGWFGWSREKFNENSTVPAEIIRLPQPTAPPANVSNVFA